MNSNKRTSSSEDLDIILDKNFKSLDKNCKIGTNILFEEFSLLTKKLKSKSEFLKDWQTRLLDKEAQLLDFSGTLDGFIKSEITTKSVTAINEVNSSYSQLNRKYVALNLDYQRVLKSLKMVTSQNSSLKAKLESSDKTEELLRNEVVKLKGRLSNRMLPVKLVDRKSQVDVSTQTSSGSTPLARSTKLYKDVGLDSTMSLLSVMRDIWAVQYRTSLLAVLTDTPDESCAPMTELCLLIIPMCVDQLKAIFSLNSGQTSVPLGSKRFEIMTHHMVLLHWSFVYLDVKRISMRKGIIVSLTRLADELVILLRSCSTASMNNFQFVKDNIEVHVLILLVALRTVNHANDLSLVIHHILNLISTKTEALSIFLSKLLLVPLLCRWSPVFNCSGSSSSKIIHLVKRSLDEPTNICLDKSPAILTGTGLDQLVLIATRCPMVLLESDASSGNFHVLVLLIDLLYTSPSSDKDHVIEIVERLVRNKLVRKLFREFGLVGTISGLICKYGDSEHGSVSAQCLGTLRSVLRQLSVDQCVNSTC